MSGPFRLFTVLIAGMAIVGCQTLSDTRLVASSAPQDLSPGAAATIAGDLTGFFIEHVGVGTTTISLDADGSAFGRAFNGSLRSEGFAISTGDAAGSDTGFLPLAYVIDRFDGSVLVRLSTPELNLTRVYTVAEDKAEPVSPWSVTTIARDEIK